MKAYFADLHIHIGRTASYQPVKITAANSLTLENILIEASQHKGMDIIGIIDCHVPEVLASLKDKVEKGICKELEDGGISYGNTTLFLGTETEIYDEWSSGPIHVLSYFPTISSMESFSRWMEGKMKNITLSSQRIYAAGKEYQQKVKELEGLFIPAHIFTPHKSMYGSGVKASLSEVFVPEWIDGVELGLSSDTEMARGIGELSRYPFLTNSDAHSLAKIGREYQKLLLKEPSFEEFRMALQELNGRRILANYGLNPLLGKYHSTVCEKCGQGAEASQSECAFCGHKRLTKGVSQRIREISGTPPSFNRSRPPYIHQVPLQFIPGIGPKTLNVLKKRFGTEMAVLHSAAREELEETVSPKTASLIIAAREGRLNVKSGGGGTYGRIQ
ncbi:TIGR00375 family protein [Bacillus lacus]|uniref:TIGR00375 family protein n=1 Tax=Metabacillus lacus TaxID=1983721 RepID=A0A7X2J2W5_9BACI|nr:endonuclease Q family protein [Metabacillus lacus]MRX74319.1 TIGR00375 family protein [Metabacillus lacus]